MLGDIALARELRLSAAKLLSGVLHALRRLF
jgi:hypothetical protein